MEKTIFNPKIRYGILNSFNAMWRLKLEHIITSDNTVAADEIIRYTEDWILSAATSVWLTVSSTVKAPSTVETAPAMETTTTTKAAAAVETSTPTSAPSE